ncbi:MAG: UbiA family prenyltransferase [Nitrososphaeraceae archaeon]
MFRQYLLLIRLPNTFTAPSNILTGYFAITSPAYAHSQQLFILILSSVLIYIAGTVFNDYFDIEIDLKERPYRPLPAGTITKQKAFVIAIVSLVSANILAFAVSWSSFVISTILSATVISYDFRLKNTVIGPITMGAARFLNVILGASPALFVLLANNNFFVRMIFVSLSIFLYVLAISLLSRKEIDGMQTRRTIVGSFFIVFTVIASISFAGFLGIFKMEFFANLILFAGIIIITFRKTKSRNSSLVIQKAIKNMVISIIVLDSVFISGSIGLYYGLATLLLIIPSIIFSRKLYVT